MKFRGEATRRAHDRRAPVSLTTLVDAPILAGKFLRTIAVGDKQHMTLVADSAPARSAACGKSMKLSPVLWNSSPFSS